MLRHTGEAKLDVDAGCTMFNLIPHADDREAALAGAAAVKKLLARA